MKAEDVIRQLQSRLPRYTNYFSDEFAVTSLTRSGTTVTAETSAPYGLDTGDYVHINNAITSFTLQSLTRNGDIATAVVVGFIKANTISFVNSNPDTIIDSNNGFLNAGFKSGDSIKVRDSKLNNGDYTIDTVTANTITLIGTDSLVNESAGFLVTIQTPEDHDLTEKWPIDKPYIQIIDANELQYNFSHELLTVPNRKTFTYSIFGSPPTPATGTPKLLSVLFFGYNGWHEITKIDDTHFSYEITEEPESPALGSNIVARTTARISGAVTAERAIEAYTKQNTNELWAFVVVGNTVANKDRAIYSDSTYENGSGVDYRQKIIAPFSIYVFAPSSNSIGGRQERDLMENLFPPFFKSLLRVKFPTGLIENPYSGCVFTGHGFFGYTGSYYIHEFTFETQGWIVEGDTLDFEPNVAFRDIFINYGSSISTSDDIIMTDHIDLDDVPLS